ncbi:MAG: HAD family phosphatase [Eubacteriales bacterium]|nr:HAD family phosphatase [Eubacteriales bacterium]
MKEEKKSFYPEAVVFDMDGVMFDSERIVQYSFNKAGEEMGYGLLGDENICFTLGMNRAGRKAYFKEKYGQDFPYDAFQERYSEIYKEYVKRNGLPVKPGLYEILEVLEKKGIPAAVATSSSRENALENLKRAGVLKKFRAVITGDMVKEAKPDPEIYQKACDCLDTEPCRAMALEDAPKGIIAAKRAGMYAVFVPDILEDMEKFPVLPDKKEESLLTAARWISR